MRAFALTTFLHSGTSDVSVSFFCSSACSSGLSGGACCCSRPQKHITAFLQKPGSSSGSVMEETKTMNKSCLGVCSHVNIARLLITFYLHIVGLLVINPIILLKVHPLLCTVPQDPAQSIQLDRKRNIE